MRKSGVKIHVLCLVAFVVTAIFVPTSRASAAGAICPSGGTPPPGSTVISGLEVNGKCVLKGVTVTGGILVDSNAGLELENCTVSNGIVVNTGGELDIGVPLSGPGPTGNPNTIDGGIVLNGTLDFDIFNATVYGGVTITGISSNPNFFPFICNSTIVGDLTIGNATFVTSASIGEGDAFCPGNTIQGGSVFVTNVSGLVSLEANQIDGSVVLVNSSKIEFGGNTIGGSAVCLGSIVLPPPPGDVFGNIVIGVITPALTKLTFGAVQTWALLDSAPSVLSLTLLYNA